MASNFRHPFTGGAEAHNGTPDGAEGTDGSGAAARTLCPARRKN